MGFFLLATAWLWGAAPPSACLGCHGPEARPRSSAPRIDAGALGDSAHAGLQCTDCHAVVLTSGPSGASHGRVRPEVDCTARCHRQPRPDRPGESPLLYPDSVHGRDYQQSRTTEAAKCWDCHGRHDIRPASDKRSSVNRLNVPQTCSRCHEDMRVVLKYNIHRRFPYREYLGSVHGRASGRSGPETFAAVCTDCHGVHDIQGVGRGEVSAKKPETCGRCHPSTFRTYAASIHGREALRGNPDAPLCVDCHGEHTIASSRDSRAPTFATHIADTCSTCHARPEIMEKYGIPEDKISTFISSLHGIAVGLGYKAAANCTSCHGVHDIRPASDPVSKVNPANLARTCGQPRCHPGMPARIARARVHRDPGRKASGPVYWVQAVFLGVILLAGIITVLWFVPGFIRKARRLGKR